MGKDGYSADQISSRKDGLAMPQRGFCYYTLEFACLELKLKNKPH
jgi:hypothetical protein